jgi:hypothetical protein
MTSRDAYTHTQLKKYTFSDGEFISRNIRVCISAVASHLHCWEKKHTGISDALQSSRRSCGFTCCEMPARWHISAEGHRRADNLKIFSSPDNEFAIQYDDVV